MTHAVAKTLPLTILLGAGLLPGVSPADEGTVTLYGQARLSVDYIDDDVNELEQISNGDSRLGVKGIEPLGNGIKAVFQFEVNVNLDDGAGSSGTLFGSGRNSFIGLASNYGTLALGIHDTPYRESTDKIDIFGNTLADHNTIIGNVGDGDTTAEYNRREPNTINYWSPRFEGLQFKAQYRVDEDAAVSQDRYSVGAFYENGPWYASVAYEVHQNEASGASNDTTGIKGGAAYAFNQEKTRVGVIYESLGEDDAASAFDRAAWYLNLSHKIEDNTLKVGYAHAEDSDDAVADDGANFYFAGLTHSLSKRTEVYGLYARTDNDDGGRYGLGNSTSGARGTPTVDDAGGDPIQLLGADIWGISLGINHRF